MIHDSTRTRTRSRACRRLAAAGLTCLAAAAIGPATAGARLQSTGGLVVPGTPTLTAATCAKQQPWSCARGQVLTLQGDSLYGVRAVVFLGAAGTSDDIRVTTSARASQSGSLTTVVPRRARTGPVRVIGAMGKVTVSPRPLRILASMPATDDAAGVTKLIAGGRRRATFAYTTIAPPPAGALVEAVRIADGTVVETWPLNPAAPQVSWDGFAGDEPAPAGAYALRLNALAATIARPAPGAAARFDLIEGFFPIRGAHVLAKTATQRFGGPRGHQGSDNFARCGTPLAAWTSGTVQRVAADGAAGNYVVVARPDGEAYVYMHMRSSALVNVGQRVFAGQRLGYVGQSGDAVGCHLHIELWTAPGYYKGGHAYDSLPLMRRLDAVS